MHYCTGSPTCNVLVQKGRCPAHTKQQVQQTDARRGSAQSRGYGSLWASFSRAFRTLHPICGERADGSLDARHSRCVQQGLTTRAECVDHTIPLSQGGQQYDEANLMSACLACNTWKANSRDGERGRARERAS